MSKMLIFLYGPDSYRSRQKLNEIIEHYKKTHKTGLNLRQFEEKDLDFQDFKNELQTTPMFKEKKLLILNNVFTNQEFKEEFLENSDKLVKSDHVIIFYEDREVPLDDSLFKFLKKEAKAQEFSMFSPQQLRSWLKKEFTRYQTKIDPRALDQLIQFVGNNLWQLSNEVKKLVAFKKNKKVDEAIASSLSFANARVIEVKDIEILVKPKIDTAIFKTIDAVALKNKRQALNLLHQHLEKGDSPLYLLSMINFQFRNLLLVKSQSKGLKMHPFVLRKTISQADKFTFNELKKIYRKIFEVDYSIKTGKLEPETALDLLITEI